MPGSPQKQLWWMTIELICLCFLIRDFGKKKCIMNCKVYRAILSAQIQPNSSEYIGQSFREQIDNDLKHTSKATQDFLRQKKMCCSAMAMSIT